MFGAVYRNTQFLLLKDTIIDFKQSEEKNNVNERAVKLINKLKIKFILYFILSFILLICFWEHWYKCWDYQMMQ